MNNNSDLVIAIAVSTTIMALLSGFIIYFIIIYRQKQRAFEWEREAFKQALLKTEVEIKEQTLSDISRELHDNLGQVASLIKINLNLVSPDLRPDDQHKITESLELLKQLIRDIKSLSVSLKGENLQQFGLLEMMKKDLERYEKLQQQKIHLAVENELPPIRTDIEIFLYRMFQEIFNNILKHSKASEVNVRIGAVNGLFTLAVADNGKGFDTTNTANGSGLANLKERCQMIGAKLAIKSVVGRGTNIAIELKL